MGEIRVSQDFIFYNSEDGSIKVQVIIDKNGETIWATQKAMAELFGVDRTVITKHLRNIFKESELEENVVCAKFAHTTPHGAIKGKTQTQETQFYNLDAIISVGYRKGGNAALPCCQKSFFCRWK